MKEDSPISKPAIEWMGRIPETCAVTRDKCTVLVVDDEPLVSRALAVFLFKEFEVVVVDSAEAAEEMFGRRAIDIVLTDQNLPGIQGVHLLEWVRQHSPKTMRLVMAGFGRFEDAVQAINGGQVYRYLIKPWHPDDLLQIMRSAARTFLLERSHEHLLEELRRLNLELEERVRQRTRDLEEANHQLKQKNWMLEQLALTDPLTGMPNRRAMDRLVRSELRRRTRYSSPLALGLIDVDHFKQVNDRYLYPGGDEVLIGLAKTFSSSLRTVDTIGRVGGEEFLLVAPQTDRDGALILGERIRTAVENARFSYQDQVIHITVSVGLAVAETGVPAHYGQFHHVAAAALAEAKSSGRNCCVCRSLSQRMLEVGRDNGQPS